MSANNEYKRIEGSIEVPKGTGIEGFLLAIRKVLRLPRVLSLNIDGQGKVTFTRYAQQKEPEQAIEIDFDEVAPSAIVRNSHVVEVDTTELVAASAVIALLFHRTSTDHLYPIAFIGGASSYLPAWHQETTGVPLPTDSVYGYPFYRDRHIPDETLLLAVGFGRDSLLPETQSVYKVALPAPTPPSPLLQVFL